VRGLLAYVLRKHWLKAVCALPFWSGKLKLRWQALHLMGARLHLRIIRRKLMRELGVWQRIDANAISPLRDARILNGASLYTMQIDHRDSQQNELGYLISNCLIR